MSDSTSSIRCVKNEDDEFRLQIDHILIPCMHMGLYGFIMVGLAVAYAVYGVPLLLAVPVLVGLEVVCTCLSVPFCWHKDTPPDTVRKYVRFAPLTFLVGACVGMFLCLVCLAWVCSARPYRFFYNKEV